MLRELLTRYQPLDRQESADKERMLEWIERCPDTILTRENKTAHFTASGLILNPDRNKVLLVYHTIYDAWTWTGGHTDGDADLLGVALREAHEETGLTLLKPLSKEIAELDILPVQGHMKKGVYVSAHLHLSIGFLLIGDDRAPLILNEEETKGVRWFPVEEMLTVATEKQMQPTYRKLLSRLSDL